MELSTTNSFNLIVPAAERGTVESMGQWEGNAAICFQQGKLHFLKKFNSFEEFENRSFEEKSLFLKTMTLNVWLPLKAKCTPEEVRLIRQYVTTVSMKEFQEKNDRLYKVYKAVNNSSSKSFLKRMKEESSSIEAAMPMIPLFSFEVPCRPLIPEPLALMASNPTDALAVLEAKPCNKETVITPAKMIAERKQKENKEVTTQKRQSIRGSGSITTTTTTTSSSSSLSSLSSSSSSSSTNSTNFKTVCVCIFFFQLKFLFFMFLSEIISTRGSA